MKKQSIKIAMEPSHPADFIRYEIVEELHLTESKCAEILGVNQETLSEFLNRKTPLSPELALRFEKAFQNSMDILLKMQAWHDSYTMRQRADEIHVEQYQPI